MQVGEACVVSGTYQDSSGKTKNRYSKVGSWIEHDDGNKVVIIEKFFNPLGALNKEGKNAGKCVITLFSKKDDAGTGQKSEPQQSLPDDDIGF